MDSVKLYWVGPRQSDIRNISDMDFYGSVTIFGDGENNNYPYCTTGVNRVNHNLPDEDEDMFFYRTIKELIEKDTNSRFYFYNPNSVYYITGLRNFKDFFYCVNSEEIMLTSNNKKIFHELLKDSAPLLNVKPMHSKNSDYQSLLQEFQCKDPKQTRFIFQAPVSSGGNGTYIARDSTIERVVSRLSSDGYLISVYEENNVPVNIHAFIFENRILLSPGSIQIMKEDDDRLLYRGADFITYKTIDLSVRRQFEDAVIDACKVYQRLGYRGVCGIDGIITRDGVKLLELNNRFQASTPLINLALQQVGLPSLQKINLAAFDNDWDDSFSKITDIDVNFSSFFYTDNGTKFHSNRIFNVCTQVLNNKMPYNHLVRIDKDGYELSEYTNALGYLYRLVFDTNIVGINSENNIQINENICEPNKNNWYDVIRNGALQDSCNMSGEQLAKYLLRLKISLLVQGVNISTEAEEFLKRTGGFRPATNNAIDIKLYVNVYVHNKLLRKDLIVNTPTDIKFVEFSPFDIRLNNDKLYLFYYDKMISEIGAYSVDPVSVEKNSNGEVKERFTSGKHARSVPYSEVAFLSTDRLRVHLTNKCIYKKNNQGCQFCNIKANLDVFELENIEEVVAEYCRRSGEINLRHFLVGGQTAPDSESDKIAEIIKIIRRHAPYAQIYCMVIPYSNDTIKKMYNAGMNQLSCNVEVFDDDIAVSLMPGKRLMKKAYYLQQLKFATTLLGRRGNVRSMVIVGLEPMESLMAGIEEFTKNGIEPILSIFRPLPGTMLEQKEAPSMMWLADVYEKAQQVCKQHNLRLGPDCENCQNNTLALPKWVDG